MASLNQIVKSLRKTLDGANSKKPSSYDTPATVIRVEDGTAWVHIPGGVDETPVKLTVDVSPGDEVQIRVGGGSAWIVGNATAPPTDDSTATYAYNTAVYAGSKADKATETAEEAWRYAGEASKAAQVAWDYADEAKTAAESAETSATEAKQSASVANSAANNALTQLSVVEDVAGTVNWIKEHGEYVRSKDKTVTEGTIYFKMEDGDYTPIVNPDPTANPWQEGWYVLDLSSSQTEYIMAHLAVTSRGLWVLPSGLGEATDAKLAPDYKMLLSSDGAYLYDGSGRLVTKFGENIEFSSERPQYIGGENAYIMYYDSDDDGLPDSIRIGGSNITLGDDTPLSNYITTIEKTANNTLIYDHTYVIVDGVATFTARVYSGGEEVTDDYDDQCFAWSYRKDDKITGNPTITSLGTGKTKTLVVSTLEYGGHVIGKFTPPNAVRLETLIDSDGNILVGSDNSEIVVLGRFDDSWGE